MARRRHLLHFVVLPLVASRVGQAKVRLVVEETRLYFGDQLVVDLVVDYVQVQPGEQLEVHEEMMQCGDCFWEGSVGSSRHLFSVLNFYAYRLYQAL